MRRLEGAEIDGIGNRLPVQVDHEDLVVRMPVAAVDPIAVERHEGGLAVGRDRQLVHGWLRPVDRFHLLKRERVVEPDLVGDLVDGNQPTHRWLL